MARKKHDLTRLNDPRWTTDVEPAPGDLRIIQALINTVDRKSGSDELAETRAAAGWMKRWELLDPDADFTDDHHRQVIAVRDGLRALVVARADRSPPARAMERLDEVASRALLRVRFTDKGASTIIPARDGFEGALARLFWIVVGARLEGRWPRLKLCVAKTCRRAFYDGSSTSTRKWCIARCGNLLAARRSRRRYS